MKITTPSLVSVCAGVLLFTACAQDSLLDGLVAHYRFDGDANDSSASAAHGIVKNAVPATDRLGHPGKCFRFNGTTAYVSAPADRLPQTDRTVSLWFKSEGTERNGATLLAYGGGGDYANSLLIFLRPPSACATDTTAEYSVQTHWNARYANFDGGKVTADTWNHLAVTISQGTVTLYINGHKVGSQAGEWPTTVTGNTSLCVGAAVDTAGHGPYRDACVSFFKGSLDEVRIYNRVLSPNDIRVIYWSELNLNSLAVRVKTVTITMYIVQSGLYQLERSTDLVNWSPQGVPFDASVAGEHSVDVDVAEMTLSFRLRRL